MFARPVLEEVCNPQLSNKFWLWSFGGCFPTAVWCTLQVLVLRGFFQPVLKNSLDFQDSLIYRSVEAHLRSLYLVIKKRNLSRRQEVMFKFPYENKLGRKRGWKSIPVWSNGLITLWLYQAELLQVTGVLLDIKWDKLMEIQQTTT